MNGDTLQMMSQVLEELRELRREAREERKAVWEEIAGLRTDLTQHREEFANLKGRAHTWGLVGGMGGGVLLEALKKKFLG